MDQITWILTPNEAQYILNLLGRCPYNEVRDTVTSLLEQSNTQAKQNQQQKIVPHQTGDAPLN